MDFLSAQSQAVSFSFGIAAQYRANLRTPAFHGERRFSSKAVLALLLWPVACLASQADAAASGPRLAKTAG